MEHDYERLKTQTLRAVRARLRARGSGLRVEDLEPFYNDAWLVLWNAEHPRDDTLPGFLTLVAYRRAVDHLRRHPDRRHEMLEVGTVRSADGDVIEHLDDRRRVREFLEGLEELTVRERVAAVLCYVHGYRRADAARMMGLSERRFKKVMDRASKTISVIAADIDAGTRCGRYASRNTAYALGLLDPSGHRYALTRRHLCSCSPCRADVRRIAQAAAAAPRPDAVAC